MTREPMPGGDDPFDAVHHVGISVADLDRSLDFWVRLLGAQRPEVRTVDAPFIGDLVGYRGVTLQIAWLTLPGGLPLELVRYVGRPETPLPTGSAHPGNIHICLAVRDLDGALQAALEAGAVLGSAAAVEIPGGPNKGARHVYVRDPDGVTIELRQAPPAPA